MTNISTDGFKGTHFKGTHFKPHGKISVSVLNENIIVYRAEGPFNEEFFIALESIEIDFLQALKAKVKLWAEVIIFEKSCMALDDAIATLSENLKALKADGLNAAVSAYVISSEIEGRNLMPDKFCKCHEDAGLTVSMFVDEKEALLWVNSYLKTI